MQTVNYLIVGKLNKLNANLRRTAKIPVGAACVEVGVADVR
jgi:hypothetical protein